MNRIITFCAVAIVSLLLSGCYDADQPPTPPVPIPPVPTPPVAAERTVIVYMVAENNLSTYAVNNINAMESAFSDQYGTRLMLFFNDRQGNCRLYDIVHDIDSKVIASKIIKEYAYKTNPCLPETLSGVIADCREYSQTDSYSMIFWSHGSGWLPQGISSKVFAEENPNHQEQPAPQYSFGSVSSFDEQLEIFELVSALPTDLVFDYIMFDACYMACIELVYEMRHNAHYIMASAAEVLATGYPYQLGLQYVLNDDVEGMAKSFFGYYNSLSGVWRSATTVVVETSKLDAVAAQFKKLVALGGEVHTKQQFGRTNYRNLLWDLDETATLTWGDAAAEFSRALDDAVVYEAATPMLFEDDGNGEIEVNTFSGLTVYKPLLTQPHTLAIYTEQYDWAQDTQFFTLAQ